MSPFRRFFLYLCIVVVGVACLVGTGQAAIQGEPAQILTLEKCIALALEENQKLRAAGYDVEAAMGRLTEAKARGWPILDYEFRAAPVPRNVDDAVNSFFSGDVAAWFEYKMVLGIPLTAFGQLTMARKLAEGGVAAARQKVLKEREQLIFDVKQIYYGILLGKEMKKLLGKAVDSLTSKIEGEESAEEPNHSPFEILKMKVFREELKRRLDQTEMEMSLAYDGLKIQMGLPQDVAIELDRDSLEPAVVSLSEVDKYVNASMEHNPDSKLVEVGVETKRKLWKLEKRKLAPNLGVGFYFDIGRTHKAIEGVTATDDFNNPFNFTRAGIGLRLKGTLDFHGAYGRIKKARAEYFKALYEGQMGKRGLQLDAKKAYENAVKAKNKVMSSKKSLSMSNQMVFLTKTNYELGIGDNEEYAEALQVMLASRGQYFKAVFDYNVALADLERKVGEEAYAELTGRPKLSVYEAFDVSADDDLITHEEDKDEEYEEEDSEE